MSSSTSANPEDQKVSEVYSAYGDTGNREPETPTTTQKESPVLARPTSTNTLLFICDLQETFRDKMYNWNLLVSSSTFLTKAAVQLDLPIIVTEQKPFKPTISELALDAIDHSLYTKTLFSMITPSIVIDLQENYRDRNHIILLGIESHICVLQTTLDLLRRGYHVYLPLDSITSMYEIDRQSAIDRYRSLASVGSPHHLVLTSAESLIFEIVADAANPVFKKLVPLIKDYATQKAKHAAPQSNSTKSHL